MRRVLLILSIVHCTLSIGVAQQRPQYSQYMNNWFLLNPAVAGAAGAPDARAGYRLQWAGFKDAPKSFYLTGHLPTTSFRSGPLTSRQFRKRNFHGLGAIVARDVTGPTSRTSAYLAYAYHQKLTKKLTASFGFQLGLQQFSLDGDKLIYADQAAGSNLGFSRAFPDAGVGLWAYAPRFWAGGSIQQIFRNQFSTYDFQNGIYIAHRHLFFSAGGLIPLAPDVRLVPSVLVKSVAPTPPTVDVNAKLWYQQLLWGGASFRTTDAVVFMAGISHNGWDFGYSYDAVRLDISRYQRGSHEVTLGWRPKRAPLSNKVKPQPLGVDFWR